MASGRRFPISSVLPTAPSVYNQRDQDNTRRIIQQALEAANVADRALPADVSGYLVNDGAGGLSWERALTVTTIAASGLISANAGLAATTINASGLITGTAGSTITGTALVNGNRTMRDSDKISWGVGTVQMWAVSASNYWTVSTASTRRITVDSTGELLIGTTSGVGAKLYAERGSDGEIARFRVTGATNDPALLIKAAETNGAVELQFTGSTGTRRLRFTSAGTDVLALTAGGNTYAYGQVRAAGWYNTTVPIAGSAAEMGFSGGEAHFIGYNRTGAVYVNTNFGGLVVRINSNSGNPILFRTGGTTERMRVSANGRVQIGRTTDAGGGMLQIDGAEPLRLIHANAFISAYNDANTTRTGFLQFNDATHTRLYVEINEALDIGTNNTRRYYITAAGAHVFGGGTATDTGFLWHLDNGWARFKENVMGLGTALGTKTANFTLSLDDGIYQTFSVNKTSGDLTVTLPTTNVGEGQTITVRVSYSASGKLVAFSTVNWGSEGEPNWTELTTGDDIVSFLYIGGEWVGAPWKLNV